MQPITFGAAYFFTQNYLKGYDEEHSAQTSAGAQYVDRQFIDHLVQVTGDSDIYSKLPLTSEKAMINDPQLGKGYAVVTNKGTNNFTDYLQAQSNLSKAKYSIDKFALVKALNQAADKSELQQF